MKKEKIIKEKLYDYLIEKGFCYEYDTTDGESWIFKKTDEDLEKSICIHDTNNIGVSFWFSVYGYEQQDGMRWMDKSKLNKFKHCNYTNEKEFAALIEDIKSVIIQRADEILGSMGGSFEEREEARRLERRLYNEHEQLAEKGKRILGIENVIGMRRIYIIIEYLQKLQGKDYQDILEEIFMISAIFGEIYREITNGKWEIDDKGACKCKVVAPKCVNLIPLDAINFAWKHNNYQMMINDIKYAELCKKY